MSSQILLDDVGPHCVEVYNASQKDTHVPVRVKVTLVVPHVEHESYSKTETTHKEVGS